TTFEALVSGAGMILVMDDEEPIRKLLKGVLEHLGYEVECAQNGEEAVRQYHTAQASGRKFDAVLMDLTVPGGMGGLEAAGKIRDLDPGAKLVASSGYSNAPVMSEFRRHGFDAVLPKPWTVGQLSVLLEGLLGGKSQE